MLKRHEDALMTRIDQVTSRGWSVIQRSEAYLWYDRDRLGKRFWRDLKARFEEDNEGELHLYEGDDGILLINNDALTTLSKKLGQAAEDGEG